MTVPKPEWFDTPELVEWWDGRPEPVQEVLARFNPNELLQINQHPMPYRLRGVDEHEDGPPTLQLLKLGMLGGYTVFDVDPDSVHPFVAGENGAATEKVLAAWGVSV